MDAVKLADRDAARKQVKQFYLRMRGCGATMKRAHTLATEHARKLLGTVEGAWDLATQAQNQIDPEEVT